MTLLWRDWGTPANILPIAGVASEFRWLVPYGRTASQAPPLIPLCIISTSLSKSNSSYDRRSVGQSILISGHHLGTATNFSSSSMEILLRHLRLFFFAAERPLWQEEASVIFSSVTPQSELRRTHKHTLLSPLRLTSPRDRVAQLYPQALRSLFVASYDSQRYGGANVFGEVKWG
jgi:hypothetical protein